MTNHQLKLPFLDTREKADDKRLLYSKRSQISLYAPFLFIFAIGSQKLADGARKTKSQLADQHAVIRNTGLFCKPVIYFSQKPLTK
jgi:hypothetical protein